MSLSIVLLSQYMLTAVSIDEGNFQHPLPVCCGADSSLLLHNTETAKCTEVTK